MPNKKHDEGNNSTKWTEVKYSKKKVTTKDAFSHQQSNASHEEKYPEFVPTFEFQELQPWQRVPIGCVTEMNMKNGKNYCKLDPKKSKIPIMVFQHV